MSRSSHIVLGPPQGTILGSQPRTGSLDANREVELVLRARTDRGAFAQLYRLHQPAIARYVRRRLGQGPEAEDAIAETFVAALENLARFEPRGIPFRAWLYRLALSRISRHVRALQRSRAVVLTEEHPAESGPTPNHEAALARAALQSLPRRYQEALSLHYLEELSVAEVAGILGVAEGTVKARLSRGRDRLRLTLAPKLRRNEQ